jgi:L-asparaginase
MKGEPLEPDDYTERLLHRVPELADLADLDAQIVCNLDSSNIGPEQWAILARSISSRRESFDGVVIIHGTDTMAYTAGALAFALRGLNFPVVLTGAQLPLASLRTDARRNLQDAFTLATSDLSEVGICFDGLFFRGCRAVKNDARSYRAFASPGVQPLAQMGLGVDIATHARKKSTEPFRCEPHFDPRVAVVYMHPGMDASVFERIVDPDIVRGVVLAAFGVGNAPTLGSGLTDQVARATDRGVDVVVVTQWGGRVDLMAYRTGLALERAGAIPGGRMRIEAAVPKLMHGLATITDRADRQAWLQLNVAGEYA